MMLYKLHMYDFSIFCVRGVWMELENNRADITEKNTDDGI